jgi:adenylate cyclase
MSDREIERKFLVKGEFLPYTSQSFKIIQGYLSTDPNKTVRIRIKNEVAFLTIKGKSDAEGLSRFEWEKEIDLATAQKLILLCEAAIIIKTRYIIPNQNGLFFEVDVFEGNNQGLVVAELELPETDTEYEKPDWLGEEVTGKPEYYNANLIANPYVNWK